MFRLLFLCATIVGSTSTKTVPQQWTIFGQITIDNGEAGKKRLSDYSGAVVWLEPTEALQRPANSIQRHFTLTQRKHVFEPHVLVVPVGARVEFPNEDPVFHNVFSLFQARRFDLGLYEAGMSKEVVFDKPGVSYIFCNIHSDMAAVVIALPAPYYGISRSDGSVMIEHVPDGAYRMKIWAEGASEATLNKIAHDLAVTGSLNFGNVRVETTPANHQTHSNKFGHPYDPEIPSYGDHR